MTRLLDVLRLAGVPALGAVPEVEIDSVVSDSRQARPGALFCAVRGNVQDGNEWSAKALDAGCAAVLTDRSECAIAFAWTAPSAGKEALPECRVS